MDKHLAEKARLTGAFVGFRDAYAKLTEAWNDYNAVDGKLEFEDAYPFGDASFDELSVGRWVRNAVNALRADVAMGENAPKEDHGFPPIIRQEEYLLGNPDDLLYDETVERDELLDRFDNEMNAMGGTVRAWLEQSLPSVGDTWFNHAIKIKRIH